MKLRQQSTITYPIPLLLVSSTDHVTPVTGATPTVTISKNGAAFASSAGAITEIGNGWYALAGNATDRNTLGALLIHATATGADPADDRYTIVPWDAFSATNLGLTNLDAAISSRHAAGAAVAKSPATLATGDVTGNLPADIKAYTVQPTVTGATLAASQHVIVDSGTVTTLTNLPAASADWLDAAAVKADAVTKIQNGLATPTNITAGTIATITNTVNADIKKVNGTTITGNGGATPWGPA